MDPDAILRAMNARGVDCILIGGMNFLLNHLPVLTYDVDLWVADTPANLAAVNQALGDLGGEWGPTNESWAPVPADSAWLSRQAIFCLTTRHGALDILRAVKGLEGRYEKCRAAAGRKTTFDGTPYLSLSDEDMLACQEALEEGRRNLARIAALRAAIEAKQLS